ncbi:MAG: hypothetical protein V4819_19580 [Verrucomicrobiota bacterium]
MNKPVPPKRFPAWLRGLGWLAFGLLGLVTILVVARWLVMDSGHQATKRIVGSQRKKAVPQHPVAPATAVGPASTPRGMPLASVPHFGGVLVGDKEAWKEFSKKLEEITAFLRYKRTHPEIVDGVWSFRAILQNMGVEVPETMTEAQAAAEYLKQADRFSTLLAQWREAVAKGTLDKAADYKSDPNSWRFGSLSYSISRILAMTAEARLQSGDTAGAWADWQAMKNSTARLAELYPANSGYDGSMDRRTFGLARSGMRSGAWTDDQLSEISSMVALENVLASAQRDAEREKKSITDYYMNFHKHEEQFGKDLLKTPSQFNQFVNQVKLKLITEQQIRDNMEVKLAEVDRMLSCFDPETGFYMRPTEEDLKESGGAEESAGMLGSFYFMIKDLHGGGYDDQEIAARYVIKAQSEYDQFRLAAALETYQRRTGSYPDRLDAIYDKLPGGVPLDIATGQPYFYARSSDGGYSLWGTGIDGRSDGGHDKTDVTWKHRPGKAR